MQFVIHIFALFQQCNQNHYLVSASIKFSIYSHHFNLNLYSIGSCFLFWPEQFSKKKSLVFTSAYLPENAYANSKL